MSAIIKIGIDGFVSGDAEELVARLLDDKIFQIVTGNLAEEDLPMGLYGIKEEADAG